MRVAICYNKKTLRFASKHDHSIALFPIKLADKIALNESAPNETSLLTPLQVLSLFQKHDTLKLKRISQEKLIPETFNTFPLHFQIFDTLKAWVN